VEEAGASASAIPSRCARRRTLTRLARSPVSSWN